MHTLNNTWKEIVQGTIEPNISNLALKIKINFLRMQLKSNKIGINEAVNELEQYCRMNEKMLEKDLTIIKKLNLS